MVKKNSDRKTGCEKKGKNKMRKEIKSGRPGEKIRKEKENKKKGRKKRNWGKNGKQEKNGKEKEIIKGWKKW